MEEEDKPKTMYEATQQFMYGGKNSYWRAKYPELIEQYKQKEISEKPVDIPPLPKPKAVFQKLSFKRCNRTWIPRSNQPPIQCPKCRSPYWNRNRRTT
jgi:ssDNA-binding Zn-finger/Zn-ribbon topoisomerase 1